MKNITEQKPTDELYGRIAWVVQFVKDVDVKNKKVLDIGCGYGWFELNAIKRGAVHVTGTELTDEDLVTARKYIHNKKIFLVKGSAIQLPSKDASFDTVVSWEVIEHIPTNTEKKMFEEVHRVLKKGGIFYLSTPHKAFVSTVLDPAWWLIGHRHYTKNKLEALALQTGFSVETTTIRGSWWEVVWLLNLYSSKWIFRRKPFFEALFKKQLTTEHTSKKGFTNIYFRFKKKN